MPKQVPRFVYNIDRTSRRKCKCKKGLKTWLGHWHRKTRLTLPLKCCAKFCGRNTEVGAHVRLEGGDARIPLIIPFCKRHNKRPSSQPIEIKLDAVLCTASMAECEK
jgi:hypothetical protein